MVPELCVACPMAPNIVKQMGFFLIFRNPGPPSHTSRELAWGVLKGSQEPQAPLCRPPRLPQGSPRHHRRSPLRPLEHSRDLPEAFWDPPGTPRDVLGTMENPQGPRRGPQGARKWAHSMPLSVQIGERGEADSQAGGQARKTNEMERVRSACGLSSIYINMYIYIYICTYLYTIYEYIYIYMYGVFSSA